MNRMRKPLTLSDVAKRGEHRLSRETQIRVARSRIWREHVKEIDQRSGTEEINEQLVVVRKLQPKLRFHSAPSHGKRATRAVDAYTPRQRVHELRRSVWRWQVHPSSPSARRLLCSLQISSWRLGQLILTWK